ncbi:MAG TPA: hypothetical protein VNY04_10465 [Chthoniobacterales bacterium]|nr:hypothetical protein [Chthoniobacterales bacterium]
MRGNLSSLGQEVRRRIAMAREAEFAEGGFKQACVGVEHHGRYVAGWCGYRHGG